MDLTEEVVADVTVIAIAGRLDVQTADMLSQRLSDLLASGRARLLIEASHLTYVSSAGFRALLIAAKLAADQGGRLAICSLTAPVNRVVEMAGFSDVLETHHSRDEALTSLTVR